MLAFKCARYAVCICWSSIIQEQFGGEGKPGFEGEVWGDSEDELALGEGGAAAVGVGWQVRCSIFLFLSWIFACATHKTRLSSCFWMWIKDKREPFIGVERSFIWWAPVRFSHYTRWSSLRDVEEGSRHLCPSSYDRTSHLRTIKRQPSNPQLTPHHNITLIRFSWAQSHALHVQIALLIARLEKQSRQPRVRGYPTHDSGWCPDWCPEGCHGSPYSLPHQGGTCMHSL